jgi:glycosyltransferase involved in cell wall biosynthesis
MLHIVHIIRDLDIASGGPSRSVPALARSQARLAGVKVSLLYQDRGKPVVPLADDGVVYQAVVARDLLRVKTFQRHLPQQAILNNSCIFHLHGLWSPTLHWAARFAVRHDLPYVVSTRGMLAGWSLEHKSFKKKLGWRLYQQNDLQRAACLLTTSEAERRDVTALLPDQAVALVPNGCDEPPIDLVSTPGVRKSSAGRLALAMGRLHPVKGFAELIEAWAALRPAGWRLAIAGPDEDGYRARLEELIRAHRLSDQVQLLGAVDDRQKWNWLDRCDLFVAPSKTENFGMAVAEAMLAGKPVITTTGTPWACLPEIKARRWVEPASAPLGTALQAAMAVPDAERQAMGQRARQYARRYAPDKIAHELVALYRWLLFGAERPSCVGLDSAAEVMG